MPGWGRRSALGRDWPVGYLYGKHEEATQNAYQRGLQDGSWQAQVPSGSR